MSNNKLLLPDDLMAELTEAANLAANPLRDREAMKAAHDRMVKMREEIFRRHGLLDIGVPAIRELRDDEDA